MPLWALRGPRLFLLALLALSAMACLLPLTDHLGYELAELTALLCGSLGAAPGVAAARRELGRQRAGRSAGAGRALSDAIAFNVLSLLVPVALLLLNGLRRPSCDRLGGLALFAVIAAPSAVLSAALGVAAGFLAERRAGLLCALIFFATLGVALWPIAFGPQVFAWSHLGGMFPGPIYDEAIRATAALYWFRAATLFYVGLAAGVALLVGPSLSRGPRVGALALLGLSSVGALVLSLQSERLHWKASIEQIDAALGGRLETPTLILHFPREKKPDEQKLLAQQAEADLKTVRTFLGMPAEAAAPARIDVFLYRSADEKRRLIGAADTSFTKPWLRQIHTNDEAVPHRILRHELAHAAAAELSHGLFRVPGRLGGLVPDMALIEGLAVAADWPGGEFTIHEEARALRELHLAPEVPRLFKPGLFYAESGARSYTMAGSFVRWLWLQKGSALLARAYAGEAVTAVYGELDALAAEHARFLDQKAQSPRALAILAQRFRAPGIARRTCPHEVADLARQAGLLQAQGDAKGAAGLWEKCALLEPDDPSPLLALRRTALVAGENDLAQAAQDRALAHPKLSAPQRAQLSVDAGDTAWRQGDAAAARAKYREAAAFAQWEPGERALQARLAALDDEAAWPAARKLLADADTGPLTWLLLQRWSEARPREGLPRYLLAKQMQNHGDCAECAAMAAEALGHSLPGPLFVQEAQRMRGLANWHSGDLRAAREAFEQLGRGASSGRAREAEDWLSRLK